MNKHSKKYRGSGKTTRMLETAKRLADEGRAVYLVFPSIDQAIHIRKVLSDYPSIKVETINSLTNLNWESMTLKGAFPNCVVLVDPSVIDFKFNNLLDMYFRFDPPDREEDQEVEVRTRITVY